MLRWWLRGLLGAELLAYVWLAGALTEHGVRAMTTVAVIAVLALAWRASHALGSFTAAGLMRMREQRRERAGTVIPALWREFCARLTSYNWSQPFANWVMADEPAGGKTGTPVLLVHGYFSNRGMWVRFRSRLVRDGFGPVYTIDLGPPFGNLDHFARQLGERIDAICRETGAERMHLVAHSMGGLVSRAYLASQPTPPRVQSLITLGSPHHGTKLAALGIGRAVRQMRPGSEWLGNLEAAEASRGSKPDTLSIYTRNDDLVYPPESAVLSWANNVAIDGVGHVGMLFSESLYQLVKNQITSKDGQFQTKTPEDARQ